MRRFNPGLGLGANRFTVLLLAAGMLVIPHVLPNNYWQSIFSITGVYVMLALGLNIVAGFSGLLDLSYIAFFGIGGYTFALLSSNHFGIHLHFLLAVPFAAAASMLVGCILGLTSIRLRGDYLAIVTLAFAQIFKILLLNLDTPINITGGVNGIYSFDTPTILSLKIVTPENYSMLIWSCALLVFIVSFRLKESRIGRGWQAIREDELAANAIGITVTSMKLYSFGTGALIAGFSGAVFASFQDSVFPNNFDFQQLVIVYCMVIIGGLGNIHGVIAGAVVLTILPEVLREYGGLRMMIYGIALVAIIAIRPHGLFSAIPWFSKLSRRPDKDETGTLRASTDLYYSGKRQVEDRGTMFSKGNSPLLKIENLTLAFCGLKAIEDLSFTLHKNEILSIIGPNGAGKSTLINTISGIYRGDSGRVIYGDRDISALSPHQVARAGIARTFQNLRLFNELSVLENVKSARFCRTRAFFFAVVLNLKRNKQEEEESDKVARFILDMFGKRLTGYRTDQKVSQLSYANRRRVEIARAIATGPEILLLDEPSAGMNPQETEEITEFIKELRDRFGYTILVIEHKLNLVRAISDRIIVMDHGKKLCEGSYDEVASNHEVIEAYLGRREKRAA
ncbi:MAG: branched-chain amino acid ABC transporter ATP-binding protein/permease [Desulforhopalus sp.]